MTSGEFIKLLQSLPPDTPIIEALYKIEGCLLDVEFKDIQETTEIISDIVDGDPEHDTELSAELKEDLEQKADYFDEHQHPHELKDGCFDDFVWN